MSQRFCNIITNKHKHTCECSNKYKLIWKQTRDAEMAHKYLCSIIAKKNKCNHKHEHTDNDDNKNLHKPEKLNTGTQIVETKPI